MTQNSPDTLPGHDDAVYAIHDDKHLEFINYVRAFVAHHHGTIKFRTGSGHIFYDLIKNMPDIAGYESEKMVLCKLLTDLNYGLAARLYARGVAITLVSAPTAIAPPHHISALASYTAYDAAQGVMHHCFMSHRHEIPVHTLLIPSGFAMLCEPFDYHYHQLSEDRAMTPVNAASNLPNQVARDVDAPVKVANEIETIGDAPPAFDARVPFTPAPVLSPAIPLSMLASQLSASKLTELKMARSIFEVTAAKIVNPQFTGLQPAVRPTFHDDGDALDLK